VQHQCQVGWMGKGHAPTIAVSRDIILNQPNSVGD